MNIIISEKLDFLSNKKYRNQNINRKKLYYPKLLCIIFLSMILNLFPNNYALNKLKKNLDFNHNNKTKKENSLNIIIEKNKKNQTIIVNKNNNSFEFFCCFCAMGREENLYVRELISYYKSIGVDKFVFADNNLPNTEKLSDVLQDYISNGTVDIIEIFGDSYSQNYYNNLYEKYRTRCKWLSFFDFDEYLVMHFNESKNITVQEFLSNPLFKKCDAIEFNWLMYTDNNLLYYDNRTLLERFTEPNYENYANRFVKSIVRGNLNTTIFTRTIHQADTHLRLCNSLGEPASYYPDCIIPPIFKYAYLMHFNTKSAEEYAKKIVRGYPNGYHEPPDKRVDLFFSHNKFSKEKLKVFEDFFNMTFDKYHQPQSI